MDTEMYSSNIMLLNGSIHINVMTKYKLHISAFKSSGAHAPYTLWVHYYNRDLKNKTVVLYQMFR